jgi:very-short-patch-repair endonuclease
MTANDWDVRSRQEGPKRFKDYLDYAQNGMQTLGRGTESTGGEVESPFEESVKNALENEGYSVEPQVGVGGYRIDLAIIDEDKPGRYKLGIECDGATFHSSYTARTRDRLRQEILEGKYGWRIHRIWSRDWVRNQAGQLEKIKAAIDRPTESIFTNNNDEGIVDPLTFEENDPLNVSEIIKSNCENYIFRDETDFLEMYSKIATYQSYTADALKKVVIHFLNVNGPITVETLVSVLGHSCGMYNISSRFRNTIISQLKAVSINADFIFNIETGTVSIVDLTKTWHSFMPRFNKSENPDLNRKYDQIPIEELAAVSREILKEISSSKFDDLVIETARVCSFKVAGVNIKDRIGESINWAIEHNFFTVSDDSSVSFIQTN